MGCFRLARHFSDCVAGNVLSLTHTLSHTHSLAHSLALPSSKLHQLLPFLRVRTTQILWPSALYSPQVQDQFFDKFNRKKLLVLNLKKDSSFLPRKRLCFCDRKRKLLGLKMVFAVGPPNLQRPGDNVIKLFDYV